ncbi:MAG TPA: DciA family protein [Mycobacteriales bacterium]
MSADEPRPTADQAADPPAAPAAGVAGADAGGAGGGPTGADLARAMLQQAKARAARAPRAAAKPARKRREKGDPTTFGAAIEQFLKVRGWEEDARVAAVLSRWADIAGPDIADHCAPTSLRDGELVLAAESTAWATQLRLLSRAIRDRVNLELGAAVVRSVTVNGPASARPRQAGAWRVAGGRGDRDTYG